MPEKNNTVRSLVFAALMGGTALFAAAQDKKPSPPPRNNPPPSAPQLAARPTPPVRATAPAPAPKVATTSPAARSGTSAAQPNASRTNTDARRTNNLKQPTVAHPPVGKTTPTVTNVPRAGTAVTPGGGKSVTSLSGHTTIFNKAGVKTNFETKNGTRANFDHSGRVSTIRTRSGMTINHGAHGERRFDSRPRPGVRVVGYGSGRGFAEHSYSRGGRPYLRRTYYYGGHTYAYAYRGYYYRGSVYYGYVPAVYYAPGFYGWAYNPWAVPVAYSWGWGATPWYGYYGYYFAPAPVYASPSLWITDYLIAADLQAAYEQNQAVAPAPTEDQAQGSGAGQVTLSPEVKQQIADEVKAQLAAERESAAHPEPAAAIPTPPANVAVQHTEPDETPAALDPAHRTFVVSTVLAESNADGTECSITPGDVLTRIQDTADADQNVRVLVASSQKNDCSSGAQIAVSVKDLQDMQNDFRAKISEGLGKLAENQGKNGIPTGPAAGVKANPAGQTQPDLTVAADLKAQQNEATQAEKEVDDASAGSVGSDDDD